MNVSDIAYMYNSTALGTNSSAMSVTNAAKIGSVAGNAASVSSVSLNAAAEALQKAGATSFSTSLGEEISKIASNSAVSPSVSATGITEALTDVERLRAAEFKELAGALDHSVLGNMVEGATEKDLALMSEDMLGSSKGREVLSKLMEGHFNNMVLTDSDDDDTSKSFEQATDTFSDTVIRTQDIIDRLGNIADTVQPTEDESE